MSEEKKILDLCNRSYSTRDFDKIIQQIKDHPEIEILDLSNNSISELTEKFKKALLEHPGLREIRLAGNKYTVEEKVPVYKEEMVTREELEQKQVYKEVALNSKGEIVTQIGWTMGENLRYEWRWVEEPHEVKKTYKENRIDHYEIKTVPYQFPQGEAENFNRKLEKKKSLFKTCEEAATQYQLLQKVKSGKEWGECAKSLWSYLKKMGEIKKQLVYYPDYLNGRIPDLSKLEGLLDFLYAEKIKDIQKIIISQQAGLVLPWVAEKLNANRLELGTITVVCQETAVWDNGDIRGAFNQLVLFTKHMEFTGGSLLTEFLPSLQIAITSARESRDIKLEKITFKVGAAELSPSELTQILKTEVDNIEIEKVLILDNQKLVISDLALLTEMVVKALTQRQFNVIEVTDKRSKEEKRIDNLQNFLNSLNPSHACPEIRLENAGFIVAMKKSEQFVSRLTSLDLSGTRILPSELEALGSVLQKASGLKKLNLGNGEISGAENTSITMFCQGLTSLASLEEINFSGFKFSALSNEHLQAIKLEIINNLPKNLKTIRFFTTDGAGNNCIAKKLPDWGGLIVLDIEKKEGGHKPEELKALVAAIRDYGINLNKLPFDDANGSNPYQEFLTLSNRNKNKNTLEKERSETIKKIESFLKIQKIDPSSLEINEKIVSFFRDLKYKLQRLKNDFAPTNFLIDIVENARKLAVEIINAFCEQKTFRELADEIIEDFNRERTVEELVDKITKSFSRYEKFNGLISEITKASSQEQPVGFNLIKEAFHQRKDLFEFAFIKPWHNIFHLPDNNIFCFIQLNNELNCFIPEKDRYWVSKANFDRFIQKYLIEVEKAVNKVLEENFKDANTCVGKFHALPTFLDELFSNSQKASESVNDDTKRGSLHLIRLFRFKLILLICCIAASFYRDYDSYNLEGRLCQYQYFRKKRYDYDYDEDTCETSIFDPGNFFESFKKEANFSSFGTEDKVSLFGFLAHYIEKRCDVDLVNIGNIFKNVAFYKRSFNQYQTCLDGIFFRLANFGNLIDVFHFFIQNLDMGKEILNSDLRSNINEMIKIDNFLLPYCRIVLKFFEIFKKYIELHIVDFFNKDLSCKAKYKPEKEIQFKCEKASNFDELKAVFLLCQQSLTGIFGNSKFLSGKWKKTAAMFARPSSGKLKEIHGLLESYSKKFPNDLFDNAKEIIPPESEYFLEFHQESLLSEPVIEDYSQEGKEAMEELSQTIISYGK